MSIYNGQWAALALIEIRTLPARKGSLERKGVKSFVDKFALVPLEPGCTVQSEKCEGRVPARCLNESGDYRFYVHLSDDLLKAQTQCWR